MKTAIAIFIIGLTIDIFLKPPKKNYRKYKTKKQKKDDELTKNIILGIISIFIIIYFIIQYKEIVITTILIIAIIGTITYLYIKNKKQKEENNIINTNYNFKIKDKFEEEEEVIFKKYKTKTNQTKQQKTKKEIFEENRKKRYKEFIKKNIQKGKEFELKVGKYYENLGYIVSYNGIGRKLKDEGIDIIAKNKNEILLIQCKNWTGSKKITQKELRTFIGDSQVYIEKNNFKNKNIKRIFAMPKANIDKSAQYYLEENYKILEYKIII